MLAGLLAALIYFFRGDFGGLARDAWDPQPAARRRRYRVRMAKALWLFGASALAALLLARRLDALLVLPREFAAPAAWLGWHPGVPLDRAAAWMGLAGIAGGSLIGVLWARWRGRRGKRPAMFGDFAMLLPQDRHEAWLALAAALVAGVTEELYFRLALPLMIAIPTESGWAGQGVAAILFALAHRYQGWRGMVATGLTGLLLAAAYLGTGQLWIAIAIHALIDVNGLVLRPLAAGMIRRD